MGITIDSEFDRIFHEADVRVYLFQEISMLYKQFGQEEKVQEYVNRIHKIPARITTKTLINIELNRGSELAASGQYDEALRAFDEALKLSTADPSSKLVIGKVTSSLDNMAKVLVGLQLYNQAFAIINDLCS